MISRLFILSTFIIPFLLFSADYSIASTATANKTDSFCIQNRVDFKAIRNLGFRITGPVELLDLNKNQITVYSQNKRQIIEIKDKEIEIISDSCQHIFQEDIKGDRPRVYLANSNDKILLIVLPERTEAY